VSSCVSTGLSQQGGQCHHHAPALLLLYKRRAQRGGEGRRTLRQAGGRLLACLRVAEAPLWGCCSSLCPTPAAAARHLCSPQLRALPPVAASTQWAELSRVNVSGLNAE
jgi:hypothetical protein